jgi:uncharacterized membrane protein
MAVPPLDLLFRWIHVGTAIVVVGGTVFLRFVLMPAAEKIPNEAHEALRTHLLKTWKFFVHIGVLLFLISGFYNYLVVTRFKHEGQGLYHALMGVKIVLALVVIFLASVLVGRSAHFEKLRQQRKMWLTLVLLLATLIVCISGYLRLMPTTTS